MKNNKISNWLFYRPLLFAISTFTGCVAIILLYSLFISLFTLSSLPLTIGIAVIVLWAIYGMIKRLPHDKMHRNDFIAITNGANIITIAISTIFVLIAGFNAEFFQNKINMLMVSNPVLFWTLGLLAVMVSLYLTGLIVSNTYAKYKRAREMGISPWNIILSMPFAFLLIWTPGYLIPESKQKSNLEINNASYKKFNNWVVNNVKNTTLVFFVFLLLGNMYTGASTWIWTAILLIIYSLWILRYKNNFTKNINKGYALMCVGINLAVILAMITGIIFQA